MEEKRLKAWVVDRLAEGKFDGVKDYYYYLALFTRSAWSGFNAA